MNTAPGQNIDLTLLPDFPGLHPAWTGDPPHFERAYRASTGEVVRVRFTPVVIDPGLDASIDLAPAMLGTMASASLVDEDGQVITIHGKGMVRPARSFMQSVAPAGAGDPPFDQDAFFLQAACILAEDLFRFRDQIASADLLLPPAVL